MYIYSPIVLLYFTNYTVVFLYLSIILSGVSIFLLAFVIHMPESLKYLLVKENIPKFENDLDYICEMNKASD